jgi:hypothetical protein
MPDRQATVEDLTLEFSRAQDREYQAQRAYLSAVEYRVRMGINRELAEAREARA